MDSYEIPSPGVMATTAAALTLAEDGIRAGLPAPFDVHGNTFRGELLFHDTADAAAWAARYRVAPPEPRSTDSATGVAYITWLGVEVQVAGFYPLTAVADDDAQVGAVA